MILSGSCQCSIDKSRFAVETYIREEWFKLVAYPREVGVNGFWVDVDLEGGVVA